VTKDQAEREAARLGREHPERDRCSWIAHADKSGEWRVVKVNTPGVSLERPASKSGELAAPPKPAPEQMPPSEPRREWLWGGGST
jgi:hypothetical protein